jgi:hypothetical protein
LEKTVENATVKTRVAATTLTALLFPSDLRLTGIAGGAFISEFYHVKLAGTYRLQIINDGFALLGGLPAVKNETGLIGMDVLA